MVERKKVHKYGENIRGWAICGMLPDPAFLTRDWDKVTCKFCLSWK